MRRVPPYRRCGKAGFTLVEMIITMAIFILLSASVFGIVTGVLQTTSALQDNQTRKDQAVALTAFLQRKLGRLAAPDKLTSYQRGTGDGLVQNGIVFGNDDVVTVLDAKVQNNGYYTFRLAVLHGTTGNEDLLSKMTILVTQDDPSLAWTTLMRDVQHIDWQFQDLNQPQWLDIWQNSAVRPVLVELSFQQAGDLQKVTTDFWIPRIDPVPLPVSSAAAPSTNAP